MFRNEKAFTLIEMLIVLMVITVLILLFVPNLTSQNKSIQEKGCEALVQTVQAQVHAYQLDTGELPTDLTTLLSSDYITDEQLTCQNNQTLTLNNGIVSPVN